MLNTPALNSNSVAMSSREMAELTNIRHDSVKRTIETLEDKNIIQSPQIVNFKNINNVEGKEYLFCKRDSYIIVAQLSPEFTAKLVDRWQELEVKQAFQIPQTFSAALRLAGELQEKVEQLQLEAKENAPKVEFAMAVRNLEGSCSVGEFAALIGMGRNTLFKKMRDDKVLMINNRPYQSYKDRELLCEVESMPYTDHNGVAQPAFQTRVTGKGQVFFEKKYRDAK